MKSKQAQVKLLLLLIVVVLFLTVTTTAQTLQDITDRPKVIGPIANDGPVIVGTNITFSGSCTKEGTKLVVCRENGICNAVTIGTELLCASDYTNNGKKSCVYGTNSFDEGVHELDIATCCNIAGICDTTPIQIDRWMGVQKATQPITINDEEGNELDVQVQLGINATEIFLKNHAIKKIIFTAFEGKKFSVSTIGRGIIPPTGVTFVKNYAFSTGDIVFNQGIIETVAAGNELYYCPFWDFELSVCLGEWELLKSIEKGVSYTLPITKGIQGFAEGINDKKVPSKPKNNVSKKTSPKIMGAITNTGPVAVNTSITFTSSCEGEVTKLVICRENSICNADKSLADIICESELTNEQSKFCSTTPSNFEIGLHTNDIATCCNSEGKCDSSTKLIDDWQVLGQTTTVPKKVNKTIQLPDPGNEPIEDLIQGNAEAGKPVTWTKRVTLPTKRPSLTIDLHDAASAVTVYKFVQGVKQEVDERKLRLTKASKDGNTAQEKQKTTLFVDDEIKQAEIFYKTPAPKVVEENLAFSNKLITVSSETPYSNVVVHTTIPDARHNAITVYERVNNSNKKVSDVRYGDTNGNGLIDRIEWDIPAISKPKKYEVDIKILNVQSYPVVGGNWEVRFTTVGTADLTVTAFNGTTWSDTTEDKDLRFLQVTCGEEVQTHQWISGKVSIPDYSCTEVGYETSKVLTTGKHSLEFDFGGKKGYAFNDAAGNLTIIGETGEVNISNFQTQLISFRNTYSSTPVVIVSPVTDIIDDDNYRMPLIYEITTTGFNITMCEDQGASTCDLTYAEEGMHYFVFDVDATLPSWIAIGTLSGVTTAGGDSAVTWGKTFSNAPRVWVQSQTYGQSGRNQAAGAWVDDITTSGANIQGCVHQGTGNSCTSGQPTETFGWVAIDAANAQFSSDVNFQYGTETVNGGTWNPIDGWTANYTNTRLMVTINDDSGSQDPKWPWARDVDTTTPDVRQCEIDIANDCDTHNNNPAVWFTMEDGDITLGTAGPPNVTLIDPADSNTTATGDVNFTANATDDIALLNSTLYHDFSGTWSVNDSISVTGIFNESSFYITSIPAGDYNWNIQYCDAASFCDFGGANRSFTVSAAANNPPVLSNVVLSAETTANLTTENLTVTFDVSDADLDAVYNTTDWRLEDTSIARINMPFNRNISTTDADRVIDLTTYENNGTITTSGIATGVSWDKSSVRGGFYNFDGTSGGEGGTITMADADEFDHPPFTVGAWTKVNIIDALDDQTIITHAHSSGGFLSWAVIIQNNTGLPLLAMYNASDEIYAASDTTSVTIGEWNHVAFSMNATNYSALYVNGVEVSGFQLDGALQNGDSSMEIGGLFVNVIMMNGSVDDVMFFDRTLSEEQMYQWYQSGVNGEAMNVLTSSETNVGDNWTAATYTSDLDNSTAATVSNTVTIVGAAGNSAPVVEAIYADNGPTIPAQSVIENGASELLVSFTVTDVDGTSDINDATANLSIVRTVGPSGAHNESLNTSCFAESDIDSDTANFTCSVDIQYWFTADEWNITAGIADTSSEYSTNTSNFTLQETTAIAISITNLAFPELVIGATNQTANNDPIVINNTANDNIEVDNVRVTGIDLIGEETTTETLGVGNFTVDVDTGGSPAAECTAATELVNNTATGITGSHLAAGNRTAGFGTEDLYVCLTEVPFGLGAQMYSTLNGTSWTISVV